MNSSHTMPLLEQAINDSLDKKDFVTILNTIKEPIIVLSASEKILYYNDSFYHKFSTAEKIRLKDYKDVTDIKGFKQVVEEIKASKENHLSKEIKINQNIYLLSINISDDNEMFIIVFYDISDERNLQKMKKDFITNASHELKTPLTSIKGFLELAQNQPENTQYYLEIITRNTDRIINIINDLLKLSKLEQAHIILAKETCDINKIITLTLEIFQQRLNEKGLSRITNLSDSLPLINIDKLKIEEVFINLIDNAIKCTEKGHITITTSIRSVPTHLDDPSTMSQMLAICIEDTGIGIPKKYYHRIFERFYVVDKARSRKTGGTGLGLSIVKHIVQLHNGTIEVNSKIGNGTQFTIYLPIN